MSVTFPCVSQESVTSKYVVPMISLLSDEEGDGVDEPPPSSTKKKMGEEFPAVSLKETASAKKPFHPVAHMYLKELMKHLTTKKRGCIEGNGATKKRVAEDKCVPVVVLDSSSESSG